MKVTEAPSLVRICLLVLSANAWDCHSMTTLSARLRGAMDASGAGKHTVSLLRAAKAQPELDLNPQI